MTTPEKFESGNFDKELDFSQSIRMRLVNSLTADGMPNQYKDQDILLRALDSIDKSALQRKQMQSDDSAGGFGPMVANFLATMYQQNLASPLRSDQPVVREIKADLSKVEAEEVTEYMVSQIENHGKTDYDSFQKDFLEEHPEYR